MWTLLNKLLLYIHSLWQSVYLYQQKNCKNCSFKLSYKIQCRMELKIFPLILKSSLLRHCLLENTVNTNNVNNRTIHLYILIFCEECLSWHDQFLLVVSTHRWSSWPIRHNAGSSHRNESTQSCHGHPLPRSLLGTWVTAKQATRLFEPDTGSVYQHRYIRAVYAAGVILDTHI